MTKLQLLLARGLQQGFAGKSAVRSVSRGGFSLTQSKVTTRKDASDESVYLDEWAADRVGAGQELVRAGGEIYTRVYGGGTLREAALDDLGVTKKEIIAFLISQLQKHAEHTRLETDFGPEHEGDWEYAYRVTEKNDEIPYVCGKEEIRYKGNLVFVHHFVMCPVE